jgi:hypothetical protein
VRPLQSLYLIGFVHVLCLHGLGSETII